MERCDMKVKTENLPQKLREQGLFCLWRYEQQGERRTKMPYNPNFPQERAKSNDPTTFSSIEKAMAVAKRNSFDGIGVGIFGNLAGIDIDHCIDDSGKLSPMAQDIVQTMNAYTEISPSGTGLRILFLAPQFHFDKEMYYIKNSKCGLEVYVPNMTNRYLTVTGNTMRNSDLVDRSKELQLVLDKYMKRKREQPADADAWQYTRVTSSTAAELTDRELLDIAMNARNGNTFSALWNGDISNYPSHSEADQSLCNLLAFWTNKDAARMDKLFRQSGLMRDKWDRRQSGSTYGNITIGKAIAGCAEGYTPRKAPECPQTGRNEQQGSNAAVDKKAVKPPVSCNSAANLDLVNAEQPTFYIPQILCNGVTFLNAPPKGGKSRMFMQMALALCTGGKFMGRQCKKTGVLYLPLEDEKADFESRLQLFLQGENAPDSLYYATIEDFSYEPPTLENNELVELIEHNLKIHPEIEVVLVDVFGAIRSKRQKGEDFMVHERRDVQSLIKLSARNKIAVVVSHHVSHTKRRGQLETIGSGAGSYVVAASVHAEMLLYKNEENNSHIFSVEGRRIPLQKFAVESDFPRWRFAGSSDEFEAANNPLIITIKHIIDNSENGKWCGFGADIVKYGTEHGLPAISEKINKNTFSAKFLKQLGIVGIKYQQLKNGKGAPRHQFEKI